MQYLEKQKLFKDRVPEDYSKKAQKVADLF
jgi:hypothetical protein